MWDAKSELTLLLFASTTCLPTYSTTLPYCLTFGFLYFYLAWMAPSRPPHTHTFLPPLACPIIIKQVNKRRYLFRILSNLIRFPFHPTYPTRYRISVKDPSCPPCLLSTLHATWKAKGLSHDYSPGTREFPALTFQTRQQTRWTHSDVVQSLSPLKIRGAS